MTVLTWCLRSRFIMAAHLEAEGTFWFECTCTASVSFSDDVLRLALDEKQRCQKGAEDGGSSGGSHDCLQETGVRVPPADEVVGIAFRLTIQSG